jgi:hypothetical protein
VFYVGSDNIYPAYLQEYGYVIGSVQKTQEFIQNYWTPLWEYQLRAVLMNANGGGATTAIATMSPDTQHVPRFVTKRRYPSHSREEGLA